MIWDVRRVRLASGLVLFTYVALHLANHALGNVSLATMEWMLRGMKAIWQSPPGAALLYSALTAHMGLAFWALYERRHFGFRPQELAQLVLGVAIPVLLANHILATRISLSLFGTEKGYAHELYSFWVGNTTFGAVQLALLLVAWSHGCMGVFFWLRLKRWFAPVAALALALAVTLPVLALLGFYQAGRIVRELAQDPAWAARTLTADQIGTGVQNAQLAAWRGDIWLGFAALCVAVLAARWVRVVRERRGGLVQLDYVEGRMVRVPRGVSVLDASILHGVPHLNVCGGRGRCSTCRIRVWRGLEAMPPPHAAEAAVLARIAAGPGVRLACQMRPDHDVTLGLLLPTAQNGRGQRRHAGDERTLVLMFVDLRGFVPLAERRLPFDTVFIINSFLAAVGDAVAAHGGQANQVLGDGLLALFGLTVSPAHAARQALAAAAAIAGNVARLNERLHHELATPLGFGIGIHSGEVVVGEIGPPAHQVFTALGDPVNVTARLQAMTRPMACEVLVSDAVYCAASAEPAAFARQQVSVRGRAEPLWVRAVPMAADLAYAAGPRPPYSATAQP